MGVMDLLNKIIRLCSSRIVGNGSSIISMKRLGNQTTPIAKLPVEIMARIFFLLATRRRTAKYYRLEMKKKCWDWLELTRVCRSWRNVALGCPSLWAEIRPSFSKERAEVFLERSRHAALNVELGDWRNDYDIQSDVLKLISRRMNQVQIFSISTYGEIEKWNTIQNLFQDAMPRLTQLKLQATRNPSLYDDPPTSVQLQKLASFVSANAISLRLKSLSLSGVTLPWSSPIFVGLSALSLKNIEEDRYRPTMSEFLAILAASPNLRVLVICKIGPHLSEKKYQSVALHRLRLLHISKIEHCTLLDLFDNLVIPKDVDWWIVALLNPFIISEKFPDSLLDRSTKCNVLTINISDDCLGVIPEYCEEDTSNDPGMFSLKNTIGMYLDLKDGHAASLPQGFSSFFQSLKPLFGHPFFNNVITLKINLAYLGYRRKMVSLTAAAWTHLFTTFPNIKALDIQFYQDESTTLEDRITKALVETQNSTIFLELETLTLRYAYFSGTRGRQAFEMLLSYLVSRRQNDRRLKRLIFRNCTGIGEKETKRVNDLDITE